MDSERRTPKQITALTWVLRAALGALLFLGPLLLRWILVYHHVANLLPEFSSTLFYLTDIPLLLAASAWLALHFLDAARPVRFSPWFITLPLALLATWSGLSVLWATSKSISVEMFVRLGLLLLLYLLIRNEPDRGKWAAWILSAGMAVQAALATAQFWLQGPVGLFFLGELNLAEPAADRWIRGYGLSANPNILSGYLVLGLAATLALSLSAARLGRRMLLLGLFALGVSGLICTFSRSAWLGLALGLGLATIVTLLDPTARARWGPMLLRIGLVGLLVGLVYVAIWPHYFHSRLLLPLANVLGLDAVPAGHPEVLNLQSRQQYAQVAWTLVVQYFPLGVGSANFTLASYLLEPHLLPQHTFLPVHNVFLLLVAELGPLGGLCWLVLQGGFVVALWRGRASLARCPYLLGWSVATLALWLTSMFDFYIWGWHYGRLIFWISLGLWARAYTLSSDGEPVQPSSALIEPG